jgi:hypothetical protein
VVADSLLALLDSKVKEKAVVLASKIKVENGVQNAADAFYRHLPLKDMLCDISTFMGESKLAQVFLFFYSKNKYTQ